MLNYLIHTQVHCRCWAVRITILPCVLFLQGTTWFFLLPHFFALIHLSQEALPNWPSQCLALPALLQRSSLSPVRCCIWTFEGINEMVFMLGSMECYGLACVRVCVCVCVCVCACVCLHACTCECVSCSVMPESLWPHRLQPARLLCLWNSPGKNTWVGCHSLLQGIFLTQGLNLGLLHCGQILYGLSQQESPMV